MHAALILCLLPLPRLPTPNLAPFDYPQLPCAIVCELCYHQCEADRQEIAARLELVDGWQRHRLLELRGQVDRTAAVWMAAWWVSWPQATPEQREEWAVTLAGLIGADAFWRGEMPLPLSLRGR